MKEYANVFVLVAVLVMAAAVMGMAQTEAFRTFWFVPRWQTRCSTPENPIWSGAPRRYPRSDPPWGFATYISEPFTDSLQSASDRSKAKETASGYNFPIGLVDIKVETQREATGEGFATTDQLAEEVALASRQGIVQATGTEDPILSYAPNGPAPFPAGGSRDPYALLADEFKTDNLPPGSIGTVNSKSCFLKDFGRLIERTGNFKQMTNNFEHGYPDSCSAPYHELILDVYKDKGLRVYPEGPPDCI
jgi:hypothetical protein